MSDLPIQGLRRGVLGQAEHIPAAEAGHAPGSGDEEEPERAHATEQVRVGPLAGPRLRFGQRLQLEAADQIVGEDAELLPRAVGRVVLGRDHVERELAFELGEGLLLRPTPAGKGPQRREAQGQVGGHGRILVVPVIGGEQIQLEVPARLVVDVLSVQHHAEPEVLPLRNDQLGLVAGDARGHRVPAPARGRDRLEREPAPVPHLDRVATVPGGEQVQNPALEEGGVHAELQGHAPAEAAAEVVDEVPQERDRLLGVVDFPGRFLRRRMCPVWATCATSG